MLARMRDSFLLARVLELVVGDYFGPDGLEPFLAVPGNLLGDGAVLPNLFEPLPALITRLTVRDSRPQL